MKIPTDLKVLSTIYKLYYEEFKNHSREPDIENGRQTKIYVPIDCKAVAKELDVDGDIVFGRLYYHLEQKHGYTRSDGSNVVFFSLMVGADRHCINFPLMVSVLAGLQEGSSQFQRSTWISAIAVVIALAALVLGK